MHFLECHQVRRELVGFRVDVYVHDGASVGRQAPLERGPEFVGGRDALAVRAHALGEEVPADLAELGVDVRFVGELTVGQQPIGIDGELLVHLHHSPREVAQHDDATIDLRQLTRLRW